MKIRRPAIRLFASVMVVALVAATLSGCGGDDVDQADAPREWSPIEYYFAPIWGTFRSDEERIQAIIEESIRREEMIAYCMHQLGFEYNLNPTPAGNIFISDGYDNWPRDREFAQTYGFGLSSSWHGPLDEENVDEGDQWVDPNAELLERLSPAEQQEWQLALWGDPDDWKTVDDYGVETWTFDGCWWWASEQTSLMGLRHSDEFGWLFAAHDDFLRELHYLPDIMAVNREWSQCMAAKGFSDIPNPREASFYVSDRNIDIWTNYQWVNHRAGADPESPIAVEAANVWAEAFAFEIELALAHVDCRYETDWDYRWRSYRHAAEQQFVDDHRSAIVALRLAVEQGQF